MFLCSDYGLLRAEINGSTITYDDSSNPLSYYNGSSYTFTWTQGRRLATAVKGSTTASFTYNESGIRTSKIVDGVTHEYVVDGTKIISDCWLDSAVRHYIAYIYDAKGVIGMVYRNHTMDEDEFEYYIFEKNLQGDIVAVYDTSGTKLVSYTYDAWGNFTPDYEPGGDSTAVIYNSFRYRGYFYDEETGLYYLNSRYYDPATGRFLNADVFINANGDLTGFNMYAYCSNNPVMGYDPTGEAAWWQWTIGIAVVATCITVVAVTGGAAAVALGVSTALGAVDGAVCAAVNGGDPLDGALAGGVGGAVGGTIGGFAGNALGSTVANLCSRVTSSTIYDVGYEYLDTGTVSKDNILNYAADVYMDSIISSVTYSFSSYSGDIIEASINGVFDGIVDVSQTLHLKKQNNKIMGAIQNAKKLYRSSYGGGKGGRVCN